MIKELSIKIVNHSLQITDIDLEIINLFANKTIFFAMQMYINIYLFINMFEKKKDSSILSNSI